MQDDYSGVSLAALAALDLEVYELIPDYRERCPLCSGAGCAVRHGLYRRRVVDHDGASYDSFPVPRFRCRRRGPRAARAVTFSVLPAQLVPRRRASLPLMVWILERFVAGRRSMGAVLDALAEAFRDSPRPWYPEGPTIYRMVHLFSAAHSRLPPLDEAATPPVGPASHRRRARRLLRLLTRSPRASPVVLAYHRRRFPRILFGPRRARPLAVHTP